MHFFDDVDVVNGKTGNECRAENLNDEGDN